jgi:S-adenosyl methyltransferase
MPINAASMVTWLFPRQLLDRGFPNDPVLWYTALGIVSFAVGAVALRIVEAHIDRAPVAFGQLMAAVPAGSYLALSQVASDIEAEQMAEAARRYNRLAHEKQRHRSHAEVARFFDGLDLVEPGLVPVQEWRPGPETNAGTRSAMWAGVARKR